MKKLLALLVIIFSHGILSAQAAYEIGVIPEFNFGGALSELWSVDVEFASRFEAVSGRFGEEAETDVFFGLLDVTTVVNRTVGVDAKVGLGYLARFQEEQIIHRFIQQYAFTNPYFGYRLGHRFRVDETFRPNRDVELRLRYRLSSDISLNGEFIDPKEIYLKIGNEYVGSFQGDEVDLEIRLVPTLGYYVNDDHKIELGIDYRVDSFLQSTADHRFWLSVGYYLSL